MWLHAEAAGAPKQDVHAVLPSGTDKKVMSGQDLLRLRNSSYWPEFLRKGGKCSSYLETVFECSSTV